MSAPSPPVQNRPVRPSGWRDRREWLRGLGVALIGALFLSLTGAFGTGEAPWITRLGYWITVMAPGSLFGGLVVNAVARRGWFEANLPAQGALASVLIAAPYTLAVWLLTAAFFGFPLRFETLPGFVVPVLSVSVAMTAINYLVGLRVQETHAAPAGAAPPRFLERLPFKLKGAEIHAVEAEDHYLRVHTSKGSDLILMRLSDAVTELEGLEGARVHRSWWVARDAIESVERGDGRAALTLKGGVEVPVSRTYAKALREAGWW